MPSIPGGADFGANAPQARPTKSTAPEPSAKPLRFISPTRYPTAMVRNSAVIGEVSRIVRSKSMHSRLLSCYSSNLFPALNGTRGQTVLLNTVATSQLLPAKQQLLDETRRFLSNPLLEPRD